MSQPNGGLITETNAQYYAGSQIFIATERTVKFFHRINYKISILNITVIKTC